MRKDEQLSQALIVYTGWGSTQVPALDLNRVALRWGAALAQSLAPRLDRLLIELNQLPIHWAQHDLISDSNAAKAMMRERHPELTEAALEALDWKLSFDWR